MGHRVAVDIGGTFTDFCVFDEASRALTTLKVLSRPDLPGAEILEGVRALGTRFAVTPEEIVFFTHGTTVGVNTVIQRSGAALALFVTEGFEDVLALARLKVPDPYDLFSRRPEPLAPRARTYGIGERLLKDGSTARALGVESARAAVAHARAAGAEAIVVALLHSYVDGRHERAVREIILAEAPEMSVTLSSEVWPVIREYERTVTATVAGYVQRRVADYLTALEDALAEAGAPAQPMIGKSSGGMMSTELGKTDPISMLLSGTAAGVVGAADIAARIGDRDVLSFDVGGTSADVAVIRSGEPAYGVGELVGEFPIYVPTVSVTSIGEGGGSIAWVDEFGVLKVGPESAGSMPGPACYGRGGTQPTVTDAFAALGLLGAAELGYGAVSIDRDAAEQALAPVGVALGVSVRESAEAVLKVSVAGMFLGVSKLLSRYGADPRGFSLLAFGGAGPMTACLLAREIGVRRVIVPPTPGVLSAYGGLICDIRNDFIRTVLLDVDDEALVTLEPVAAEMETTALTWLREEQGFDGPAALIWSADMRYRGQSYEIETVIDRADIAAGRTAPIAEAFHAAHHRAYDHADPEAEAQIVNLRVVVAGSAPKPDIRPEDETIGDATPDATLSIFLDDAEREAGLYRRAALRAGHRFRGPAVVAQDDCTTVVPPGFAVRVDGWGNLLIAAEE